MNPRNLTDQAPHQSDSMRDPRHDVRAMLCREVVRWHARRRRNRSAAMAFVFTGAVAALAMLASGWAGPPTGRSHATPVVQSSTMSSVTIIKTESIDVERYRIETTLQPIWCDDDELLDAFNAAGQPSGLMRTADSTVVLRAQNGSGTAQKSEGF